MAQIVIATDGDYVLPETPNRIAMSAAMSTVMIMENVDGATVTFGLSDEVGAFKAYPDGTIAVGDTIYHGRGVVLMARVIGITSNPVKITYNPSL